LFEGEDSGEPDNFVTLMHFFHDVTAQYEDLQTKIGPIQRTIDFLRRFGLQLALEDVALCGSITERMATVKDQHFAGELKRVLGDFYECGIFEWSCLIDTAQTLLVKSVAATPSPHYVQGDWPCPPSYLPVFQVNRRACACLGV
jgi:hypothetical protein